MRDNLVTPLLDRATQEADLANVVRYLAAWRELDRHMQGEMQWTSAWLKVQQHLGQIESRLGILRQRWTATPLGAAASSSSNKSADSAQLKKKKKKKKKLQMMIDEEAKLQAELEALGASPAMAATAPTGPPVAPF